MIALTLGLSVSNGQRIVDHGVGRLRTASHVWVPIPVLTDAPILVAA
jgi:hypothetical protein